ncbi:hypothetical protein M3Y99_01637700 [Aphelenchoides fujianensis]|nr:hypothetical protein M3Y99_01637700 [Aphelenchoides fujianensis]
MRSASRRAAEDPLCLELVEVSKPSLHCCRPLPRLRAVRWVSSKEKWALIFRSVQPTDRPPRALVKAENEELRSFSQLAFKPARFCPSCSLRRRSRGRGLRAMEIPAVKPSSTLKAARKHQWTASSSRSFLRIASDVFERPQAGLDGEGGRGGQQCSPFFCGILRLQLPTINKTEESPKHRQCKRKI